MKPTSCRDLKPKLSCTVLLRFPSTQQQIPSLNLPGTRTEWQNLVWPLREERAMEQPTPGDLDTTQQSPQSSISPGPDDDTSSGSSLSTEAPETSDTENPEINKIKKQVLLMLDEAWMLNEDYEKKMEAVKADAALYRKGLNKAFQDLQDMLEKERNVRLSQSKRNEEQTLEVMEAKALVVVNLASSMNHLLDTKLNKIRGKRSISKTKLQVAGMSAQLDGLMEVEVELDDFISPLQLREWRGMRHVIKPAPEQILFDPQTAHPNLVLSLDCRRVRFQALPGHSAGSVHRFHPGLYVLGQPAFQSGRHYWEVDVGHKSNWIVGVVKESVNRKTAQELTPMNGYWVLRKQQDYVYFGIGVTPLSLSLRSPPLRIGISLDFFSGHLAFYDADNTDLIFDLSNCPVTEKLFPFFCPGVPMREEDWYPLTLCT